MQNASYDFAYKSNALIVGAQNDLNNGMFSWVKCVTSLPDGHVTDSVLTRTCVLFHSTTTSTMNETLNEFMDGIADALNVSVMHSPRLQDWDRITDSHRVFGFIGHIFQHAALHAFTNFYRLHHRAKSSGYRRSAHLDARQRVRRLSHRLD